MSIDDLNKLVIGEEVFLSSKMNNTVSGYDIKGEMVEYSFGEEVASTVLYFLSSKNFFNLSKPGITSIPSKSFETIFFLFFIISSEEISNPK